VTAVAIAWPETGELVRRVVIRLWSDSSNFAFAIDQNFDVGISRWAKIEPIYGIAYWGNQQVCEETTHRIWLRWGTGTKETDITAQHVIDYPQGNRRYRVIRSLNIDDVQRFTRVDVKDLGAIA